MGLLFARIKIWHNLFQPHVCEPTEKARVPFFNCTFSFRQQFNSFMTKVLFIWKPVSKLMDWFLYDMNLRHERVN